MAHAWVRDLPDLPSGLRQVSLYYDPTADTYLVSGGRDRVGMVQYQVDGDIFRRRYPELFAGYLPPHGPDTDG